MQDRQQFDFGRRAACNTGFASGGVTCKLGALFFYQSLCLVDSEVLRNRHLRVAAKRCVASQKDVT
jgi:hypothetical protein